MKAFLLVLVGIFYFLPNTFGKCKLENLQVSISECHIYNEFYATIDFDFEHIDNVFQVVGSGIFYGFNNIDELPIVMGPLIADCNINFEFIVIANAQSDCLISQNVGNICCENECFVKVSDLEVNACNDPWYSISFKALSNDPSNEFEIHHKSKHFDLVRSVDGYIVLDSLSSPTTDTENSLYVCTKYDKNCCSFVTFKKPSSCDISNIRTQIVHCNPEDSTFALRINFDHAFVSDSFKLGGNGTTYGIYGYDELPITITNLPFDSTKIYEFLVLDKDNPLCFNFIELDPVVDCNHPCSIESVKMSATPCDEAERVFVYFTFEDKNTSVDGFTINVNGEAYGHFQYGHEPYKVGSFHADCKSIYEFVIKDASIEDCSSVVLSDSTWCCKASCELYDLTLKENCNDDMLNDITLDFKYKNTTSDTFKLTINGQILGSFSYNDLPLKLHKKDLTDVNLQILITDSEDSLCFLEGNYEINCPLIPCNLSDPSVNIGDCIAHIYSLELNFNHSGNSRQFKVKINEDRLDAYNYENLPITLTDLDADNSVDILIWDAENENCVLDISIIGFDCTTSAVDVEISDVKITHDNHTLTLLNTSDKEIAILGVLDIQGRMMPIIRNNQPDDTMDIGYLVPGIYWLRLQLKDVVLHKRFVKF